MQVFWDERGGVMEETVLWGGKTIGLLGRARRRNGGESGDGFMGWQDDRSAAVEPRY